MANKLLKRFFSLRVASILLGLLIAYSVSVHFARFYDQSVWKKIILILILCAVFAVLNIRFFFPVVKARITSSSKKQIKNRTVALIFAIVFFFLGFYRPEPLYAVHSIEIIMSDQKNELSQGNVVEIIDLVRENQINKGSENFLFSGNWETTDFPLLGIGAGTTLKHSWEGRGGGEIEFRTSPTGGIINLISENDRQEIDLYSPEIGTKSFGLQAAGLSTARIKWQVLGIVAIIADGVAISWLFALFMLLLTRSKDTNFWLVSFLIFVSLIYSTSLHLLPINGFESTLQSTLKVRNTDNRLSEKLGGG